ncbi:MAG TPA: hypothetical protein VGK86_11565 [Thermoanaerobaculia bacterium]|jgi:hypothetical protein
MRRAAWLAVTLLLPASLAQGSGLDDLRGALEKLRAKEAIRARIAQENQGEFNDDGQKRTRQGRATIVAEDGGTGQPLRLVYDDAMLTQAARERAGRRDSRGPGDAVRDLDALRVLDLLRSAEKLLDDLDGAQLVSEKADGGAGGAARVLELTLRAPRGIDQEKGFKVARTAKIWIDAGGAPVTSEVQTHTEVRRLIFKVKFDTTDKNAFAVAGHRLVTRHRETENRWKASIFAEGSNRSATTVEVVE